MPQPGRPIVDRKRLAVSGNKPAAAPSAAKLPAEDLFFEIAVKQGTTFDVHCMNGDVLRGAKVTAHYKFAIVVRASDGQENYCFKHAVVRLERVKHPDADN
jgi:sRNA-binding regulator protein Hfq